MKFFLVLILTLLLIPLVNAETVNTTWDFSGLLASRTGNINVRIFDNSLCVGTAVHEQNFLSVVEDDGFFAVQVNWTDAVYGTDYFRQIRRNGAVIGTCQQIAHKGQITTASINTTSFNNTYSFHTNISDTVALINETLKLYYMVNQVYNQTEINNFIDSINKSINNKLVQYTNFTDVNQSINANLNETLKLYYMVNQVYNISQIDTFFTNFHDQDLNTTSDVVFNTMNSTNNASAKYYLGIGGSLNLSILGASTYSTIQDMQNQFHSTGWITGGTITDAGSGNIDISAGSGYIRAVDDAIAELFMFDWAASTGNAIPIDTTRYVGVEYNAGSPQVVIRTTENWNYNTDFPLGEVINEGGTLHVQSHKQAIGDHASNMIQRLHGVQHIARDGHEGGLIISETGTRNLAVTAGTLWLGLESFAISAIDTSGTDEFDRYYRDGVGGYTRVAGAQQWNNSHYDDGDGTLGALTNNWYSAQYFYLETDGDLVSMYGQAQYANLASAENDEAPSSVPLRISEHAILIGRVIFREGGATAQSVETTFVDLFSSSGVTDHGQLAGLTDDDHDLYTLDTALNDTIAQITRQNLTDHYSVAETYNITQVGVIHNQDLNTTNDVEFNTVNSTGNTTAKENLTITGLICGNSQFLKSAGASGVTCVDTPLLDLDVNKSIGIKLVDFIVNKTTYDADISGNRTDAIDTINETLKLYYNADEVYNKTQSDSLSVADDLANFLNTSTGFTITADWILNGVTNISFAGVLKSMDWTNVTIKTNQITDFDSSMSGNVTIINETLKLYYNADETYNKTQVDSLAGADDLAGFVNTTSAQIMDAPKNFTTNANITLMNNTKIIGEDSGLALLFNGTHFIFTG